MAIITKPIVLHDIQNCEAFVQRTIDASGIQYSPGEREELLSEGLTILFELAGKYRPLTARPGVDKQPGRFSGYAAMFLPRRLGDAWHRWHPEHRYVTDPATGKRRWYYDHPMISLDGLNQQEGVVAGGARHDVMRNARPLSQFCHTGTISFPQAA